MGNIFAGSEIVELGVCIEENGRDFYQALTEKTANPDSRRVFEYLAGEEAKHIVVFKKILEKVEKYEPAESYPGEYFAYMRALAEGYVFTQKGKGKELAKNTKSEMEALNLGIGFEKDSILFYEGMKKAVPEYDHKVINELIAQEQQHLSQLTELKRKL